MTSLLILLFLREATGATFFLQYESENQTRICNESDGGSKAAWWLGENENSLQKFEQGCCDKDGNFYPDSKTCNHKDCPNELNLGSFHNGGIFACKTLMGHSTRGHENPLFSSNDDCKDFNFFIVATISSIPEQPSQNIRISHSEKEVFIEEKEKFSLSCEFELKEGFTTFAMYWFKETKPSRCLFSVSNEGQHGYQEFDTDVNCCIDEAFKGRRISNSTASGPEHRLQSHIVTIANSTMADSGIYFCVVAAYNKKFRWTIESRIPVSVGQSSKTELKIALGVIAAMLLVGGIISFLCWRKNAKGKPLECQQRDQATVATEDCSPYAISSRSDLVGKETVYSLATGPGEAPSAARSSPESEATPGVQHGGNVEALYSKVLKDGAQPHLASDVGLPST